MSWSPSASSATSLLSKATSSCISAALPVEEEEDADDVEEVFVVVEVDVVEEVFVEEVFMEEVFVEEMFVEVFVSCLWFS